MADTTTPLLGLLLQATGGNNNSWGDNLNTAVITLIENAIAGTTTLTNAGGAYTLTAAEARSAIIIVNSTLTSDLTLTVPATSKKWTFVNIAGGGAFSVLVKSASTGNIVQIPQNSSTDVVLNVSSGNVRRLDTIFVGNLFYHAGATAPQGSLVCNGALLLRASYPNLFTAIGTTWGAGDGFTTFALPNGQDTGRYLRSSTSSLAVGTSQASQNKAHTHTGSGTTAGMSADHTHTGSGTTGSESVDHTHTGSGTTSGQSASHTHAYAAGADSFSYGPSAGAHFGFVATANNTGAASNDHTHTYSFTTSGRSAVHTHTFSFTTGGVSADHTHTFSFTTSGGSADGTDARPESLVGLLCIRY